VLYKRLRQTASWQSAKHVSLDKLKEVAAAVAAARREARMHGSRKFPSANPSTKPLTG